MNRKNYKLFCKCNRRYVKNLIRELRNLSGSWMHTIVEEDETIRRIESIQNYLYIITYRIYGDKDIRHLRRVIDCFE